MTTDEAAVRRKALTDISEDLKYWMEDPALGFTASQYARVLRRIQWNVDQTPARLFCAFLGCDVPPFDPSSRFCGRHVGAEKDLGDALTGQTTQFRGSGGGVETRKAVRGHLNGCALDADHQGLCYGSGITPEAAVWARIGSANPSPALSPRQALGEALACTERAVALMGAVSVHLSGGADRAQAGAAHDRLTAARSTLSRLYESAK